jgi:hypothetical protein
LAYPDWHRRCACAIHIVDWALSILRADFAVCYVAWFWEFLLFEACFNFGLLVAALFNLYGYFTCKSWFPKLYQVVLIGSVIFLVGDAWVSGLFFPDNPDAGFGDKAVARDIGRSIGQALIWVPYMQVSKRVRNTFVN